LKIDVPENLFITELDERDLDPDWRKRPELSRAMGDKWLEESASALLSVPSAIVPHTQNYLINPIHRDTKKIKIHSHGNFPFDFRLFQ
jgi:RES domain-containing protein